MAATIRRAFWLDGSSGQATEKRIYLTLFLWQNGKFYESQSWQPLTQKKNVQYKKKQKKTFWRKKKFGTLQI